MEKLRSDADSVLAHVRVVQPWFEARLNRIYSEMRMHRKDPQRLARLRVELANERRKAGLLP